MPVTRTLQREVRLVAQGQYEQRGDTLYLTRWRLIADGEPHEWQPASGTDTGGWSSQIKVADLEPARNAGDDLKSP